MVELEYIIWEPWISVPNVSIHQVDVVHCINENIDCLVVQDHQSGKDLEYLS